MEKEVIQNEENQRVLKKKKLISCWNCRIKLEKPEEEGLVDKNNLICPKCGVEYADKPFIEAKLHILQKEYLGSRDQKIFVEMLKLMEGIIYNQIVSKLRKSGVFLDPEEIQDRVHWSIEKILILYSNVNFKINTSFIEYLGDMILYPMYNYKQKGKDQNEVSIFTPIGYSKTDKEKEYTYLDQLKETPIFEGYNEVEDFFYGDASKSYMIDLVTDYVDEVITISNKKKGFETSLKMAILFNQFLNKKSDRFFAGWWKTEGLPFRDFFEKSVTLMRDTIYYATQT